jgi:alkylresorcinol/alkylpyrone synthase
LNAAVKLISLATASPPHVVEQKTVAERARAFLAERYRDFDRLYPVFRNSGIERRQTVMPLEWYLHDRTWRRGALHRRRRVGLGARRRIGR